MTTTPKRERTIYPGVYRRGDRYVFQVDLGWKSVQVCRGCGRKRWLERSPLESCLRCGAALPPPTEARRQVWPGKDPANPHGFKSAKAAERARRKAQGGVDDGSYVAPSKETVGTFLAGWLDGSRSRVRPSTFASYRVNVEHHLIPALGSMRLQALTVEKVNAFYADLSATLSPKSIRNVHVILRKALGDAVRWGRLTRNVAADADLPRISRPELHVWDASELGRFLAAVKDDRLYAVWTLACTTGMRRGELLGLRREDLDLSAGELRVAQAIVVVDGRAELSTPKTEKGRRTVGLDPGTVAVLKAHLARQSEERLAWGPAYVESGLVFTREDGSAIHPDGLADRFAKLAADAKLPKIRFHDLRHSYATAALRANVQPKIVSERLGHATTAFTMDVYAHVLPAADKEAAALVADLIRS